MGVEHQYYWAIPYDADIRGSQFRPPGGDWLNFTTLGNDRFYRGSSTAPSWYAAGVRGQEGVRGEQGPAGEQGYQGPQGETGPTGERGPTGATGEKGKSGIAGVAAQDPYMATKFLSPYRPGLEGNSGGQRVSPAGVGGVRYTSPTQLLTAGQASGMPLRRPIALQARLPWVKY